MTTWHPLNSFLLDHCAVDTSVNSTATDHIIFHSNEGAVVIQRFVLIDWDVNEKKAFTLAFILDLKVLLSEPLYLFRPHTTIASRSQTIPTPCIQEPHSKLNVFACLPEHIQDIVGSFALVTHCVWLCHAERERAIKFRNLVTREIPLAIVISKGYGPV